jgi:hypothetical protein
MPRTWLTSFALVSTLTLCVGCGSDSESDGGGSKGGTGGSGGAAGSGGSAGGTGGSSGSGTGGSGPCTLGTTWEVVDDYSFASPEPTFGVGITADSAGNVYVAALGKQGTMTGIVRKSTNRQSGTIPGGRFANDIASDSQGKVYVIAGTDDARA